MRLILVRHAQTDHNYESRAIGHLDVELSEQGRVQAERLAERLAGTHIDAIYSSDLKRAMQTADAIAERHPDAPRHAHPEFRERYLGEYEGVKRYDVNWDRTDKGLEDLRVMRARVHAGIRRLLEEHPHETVLLCTHGGYINSVLGIFLHAPEYPDNIDQRNASISVLTLFDDRVAQIHSVNDHAHLSGLEEHEELPLI